jgi:hypothetical protein
MSQRAFFIDETYLKDNSPLSGNVDIAEIYPYAKVCEEIYIQEAIGTSLFNDLAAKIILDEDLSGYPNELILVKKIREAVLWYTVYKALPFISIKVRNIGLVKQTGENLTSADSQDVKDLRHECKINGDFFLKRVQDYLCDFGDLFSAYTCGVDDELPPNTDSPTPSCDIAFD